MLRTLGTLVLALLILVAGGCSLLATPAVLSGGTGINGLLFFLWAMGWAVAGLAAFAIWSLRHNGQSAPGRPDSP